MTKLNDADKIYLGSSLAAAVYAGSVKVWPATSSTPSLLTSATGYNTHYGDTCTSSAFDVPAGALTFVYVTYSDNPSYLGSITDDAGNTYTQGATASGTSDYNITTTIYYCASSIAKTGNTVSLHFPGNNPELQSIVVLVFSPATWSYDAAGSQVVAHPYAAGPIQSSAMSTAGKGVMISGVSISYNGPSTQDFYFSDGTLAESIQHGATTGVAVAFNASAIASHVFEATAFNLGGGDKTSNISGNGLFASFTY